MAARAGSRVVVQDLDLQVPGEIGARGALFSQRVRLQEQALFEQGPGS